ncbi:hypothetical protein [Bradyrhizobium liaoningense]
MGASIREPSETMAKSRETSKVAKTKVESAVLGLRNRPRAHGQKRHLRDAPGMSAITARR